jgi:hypothetical protein
LHLFRLSDFIHDQTTTTPFIKQAHQQQKPRPLHFMPLTCESPLSQRMLSENALMLVPTRLHPSHAADMAALKAKKAHLVHQHHGYRHAALAPPGNDLLGHLHRGV